VLATDEDEGESISWHLQLLKPKVPSRADGFTKSPKTPSVKPKNCRNIDEPVRAQETRRILDRLVGLPVSPVEENCLGLSAGRVQSGGATW